MKLKRTVWLVALMALYVGIMGAESCGKNAKQAIEGAKDAIEDARAVNADELAAVEFKSAEESLLEAQELFDRIRYKKSETKANESAEKARIAKGLALGELEKVEKRRVEAERLAAIQQESLDREGQAMTEADMARQVLKMVHFGFDSDALSDEAKSILNNNADWLRQHPNVHVKVEGHCDERGTDEYNDALGAKRARMAYDYLVSAGVPSTQMETISYGENFPIDPSQTEAAYAKNRRVQFAVLSMKSRKIN